VTGLDIWLATVRKTLSRHVTTAGSQGIWLEIAQKEDLTAILLATIAVRPGTLHVIALRRDRRKIKRWRLKVE